MANHKILLVSLLLCSLNLSAQSSLELDKEAITEMLYQHASDDTPGLAVGIVKDGKVVYEHYLGYANLAHKVNIDQDTRFNIASNGKQFTALCALKLIKQGKVNLEDDIRQYLPELYEDLQDQITIANLLSHTSGIRDIYTLWALQGQDWYELFIDNGDAMKLLQRQKDLNFKPGTEYLYSNSNYVLLAEIVKRVTGQAFSKYAKTMFEAIGMPNTYFLTDHMAVIPNKARPYFNWDTWKEMPWVTEIHGDGALFTTLQDQLQWEQIIQVNDGKYLSQRLINESQSPIANTLANSDGYGLMFRTVKGFDYTFHDGSSGAYHATFLRFPTKKIAIVVMGNSGKVPSNYLAWQIALPLLGFQEDQTPYPEGPDKIEELKRLQDVVGNYKSDDGTIIRITEKEGSLYRELYQRDPVKLILEQDGLFEYETIKGLKMNFTNIGQVNQQFTTYLSSQAPNTYHKIADLDQANFDKTELNGRFYNDETDTEISLKFTEGNTYSLTKNGRERKAELIFKDYLRMMDSYKIKITRDQKGNVVGLKLENGRIKNVQFKKT